MRRVLMLLSNNYANDPRVVGVAGTLSKKHSVELMCLDRASVLPSRQEFGPVKVENVRSGVGGAVGLAVFNVRVFFSGLTKNFDVIHANDFDTVLPAVLLSSIKRVPLVYDVHEDYAVFAADNGLGFFSGAVVFLENIALRRATVVYCVNPLLAQRLEARCGRSVVVLWNYRDVKDFSFSKTQLAALRRGHGLPNEYYCISGTLCRGRNIESALAWFAANKSERLVVAGRGELSRLVKDYALGHENIRFVGLLSLPESRMLEAGSKALLACYEPVGNNVAAGPPGKLFDAIASGVPIIVGPGGVAEGLVREISCGFVSRDIKKTLDGLTGARLAFARAKCRSARRERTWLRESTKLVATYPQPAFKRQ